MRSPEEQRQAVVFAARLQYQLQQFRHVVDGALEPWTGDIWQKLPIGVEPDCTPRSRLEFWRKALPPSWSDRQVIGYQYKHWCGAFTLCCLKDAGLALNVFWQDIFGYVEPCKLIKVKVPMAGDVAFFSRNQHYALVEDVRTLPSGQLVFDSIDGNQGKTLVAPSIKRYSGRALDSVAAFYSIGKFLEQAQ